MNNADSTSDSTPPTSVVFQTTLLQTGKNTVGIHVPEDVIEQLSAGKRPLVRVSINGYTYRSAVAVMAGKSMISLSADHRKAAGVQGGDATTVTVEVDTEPRTVELPNDIQEALHAGGALEAFETTAPSMKKEYIRQVEEAKTAETRERRIAKIVEKLGTR